MTKGRRTKRASREPKSADRPGGDAQFQSLWLCAISALLVATPLIPSESRPELGTGVVLTMGWLVLLLGWSLAGVLAPQRVLHWGPTSIALAVFIGLMALSGLVMAWAGQPRSVINTCWQWAGYAVAFFMMRQVVRRPIECRALLAVMIALSVCLSTHAFWQYAVTMPESRRLFEEDPDEALRSARISAPLGSPERALFRSRLYSTEPTATFTLANSLAGFLVPWLVTTVALLFNSVGKERLRWPLLGFVLVLAVVGTCCLLTKSRTAWLAAALGLALLPVVGYRARWKKGPVARVVAGVVAVLMLAIALVVLAGGLNSLVITESQKSLLYRVQYWQASSQMIRDYAWLGCGPGNFQQFYTSYKLPEASETVADPHNFMLEVWATMGTPALLTFVAVLVCFIWQLRRMGEQRALPEEADGVPVWPIYGGALAGIAIARPAGMLVGFEPDPMFLLVGVPVAAVVLALSHRWVREGKLSAHLLGCALVALLVNLLAAGGVSYAGVATSIWVLMALAINLRGSGSHDSPVPHAVTWVTVAAAGLLVLAMYATTYRPVTAARARLAEGRSLAGEGLLGRAEASWRSAAEHDPYASRPWNLLAGVRHQRWLSSGTSSDFDAFTVAAEGMLARNQRSSEARTQYGHWLLACYRARGDAELLARAAGLYRQAIDLYPNYNRGHAQLAWALHLAGDSAAAGQMAARALELDRLNPHIEQKLRQFQLYDPGPGRQGTQPSGPVGLDTEQWMERLRKGQASAR